jgi:large subunit ribosomal protein L18
MMHAKNIYTVPYRRKRESRTNYKKRLKLLLSGKTRLVVRKSLKGTYAALVQYAEQGDRIVAAASPQDLRKMGWQFDCGNVPSAYLVGLLLGKRAKRAGIGEAILDSGLRNPVKKSRVYAAVAGVVDAGVVIPHSPEVLPPKERLEGKHIAAYAATNPNNSQFSLYKKHGADTIVSQAAQLKEQILKEA